MEEIAETLLCIIDAQQSFIRRLVRIISETESVDDALRERIAEEARNRSGSQRTRWKGETIGFFRPDH